jgi:hypothetical protein
VTARDRTVIVIVGLVVAIAAAWLIVVSPERDKAAKLGDQVKSAQSQLDSARAQLAAGESAKSAYKSAYTLLARLGEAVPADDNVPSLIYQVQGAATASGVDFRTLSVSGGGSSNASSASAAQGSTAALPPGATVGPAGFPIEPFSFTFRGNFFHLSDFFGRLQRFVVANNNHVSVSGRLMTLNAISLGPGPQGFPQITASISATTYLVPASQGLTNGGSPTGPAGSSAQSVSGASSSPAPVSSSPPAPSTATVTPPAR